jgi:hypothetical protein
MPSFDDFWKNIMIPILKKEKILLYGANKTLFIGTINNLYDLYKDEEADGKAIQKEQWRIIQKLFRENNPNNRETRALLNSFRYFFTWDFQYIVQEYIFCEDDDCSAAEVANRLRINLKF